MTPSWTARARCVGRVEWTSDNPDDRVVVVGDGPRPSRGYALNAYPLRGSRNTIAVKEIP